MNTSAQTASTTPGDSDAMGAGTFDRAVSTTMSVDQIVLALKNSNVFKTRQVHDSCLQHMAKKLVIRLVTACSRSDVII